MITSDEDIKKTILTALARDEQLDAAQITVEVQNGKVTLTGAVPTAAAQSSANWITTAIPEVTDVINHLKVARPETLTMPGAEKKQ